MVIAAIVALALSGPSEVRFVTSLQDAYLVPSPDGKTLLFESTCKGRWALYTSSMDGKGVKLLLDTGDDPVTPTWSPDGRHIAYVATAGTSTEIFVIGADGSARRQLTRFRGDDEHPHWGSDNRIYWDSGQTTPDLSVPWERQFQEVFSMEADGTGVKQHTRCNALCTFASLSPDRTRLVYRKVVLAPGRNWDQSASPRNSEIHVANADGMDERNISNHPAFDGWPVWSPDSQWIAFASNRGGQPNLGQVYAVRPNGSAIRQVTTGDWSNVQPSFSPDGKRLYTFRHVEGATGNYGFVGVVEFDP